MIEHREDLEREGRSGGFLKGLTAALGCLEELELSVELSVEGTLGSLCAASGRRNPSEVAGPGGARSLLCRAVAV